MEHVKTRLYTKEDKAKQAETPDDVEIQNEIRKLKNSNAVRFQELFRNCLRIKSAINLNSKKKM